MALDTVTVANGQGASLSANTGNPLKIGAVYNTSPPAPSNGNIVDAQADSAGNLLVNVVNGAQTGTAGSPTTAVVTVQGIAAATPVLVSPGTVAGAAYQNIIAPATVTVETTKGSAGTLYAVKCFNNTSNELFIKFFDVAGSITLGTTACTFQYMIPGNASGAGFLDNPNVGRAFTNSLRWIVSAGISTTDNTAITANSVIVDITYS